MRIKYKTSVIFLILIFAFVPTVIHGQTQDEQLQSQLIESLKEKIQMLSAELLSLQFKVNVISTSGTVPVDFMFTETLKMGSRGEEVKRLQGHLKLSFDIYPEGWVTGYFGVSTENAVKRFQASNGIVSSGTPDTTGYGQVGPLTRDVLNKQIGWTELLSLTADIKANGSDAPSAIPYNTSATITWTSNNASLCSVSPGSWVGFFGSQSTGNLTYNRTYYLTCREGRNYSRDKVLVSVLPKDTSTSGTTDSTGGTVTVTADIKANGSDAPSAIPYNTSATITWTSQDAESCSVSPASWTGISGSQSTGNLTYQKYYYLTCKNGSRYARDNVLVKVQAQGLPTASISASSASIASGQSSILTWSSTGANYCYASGGWYGTKPVSGTESVSPAQTTSYSIKCTNNSGSDIKSVSVNVESSSASTSSAPPPPPPPPSM